MRPLRPIAIILSLVGLAALTVGILEGEVSLFLVLIVPVLSLDGPWSVAGVLMVAFGFFLLVASLFSGRSMVDDVIEGGEARSDRTVRTGSSGLILIGPIPIVWGQGDIPERTKLILSVLGLTLALLLVLFWLLG